MRDGAKACEMLLAAQNSKLAQQLGDVQKHAATVSRSLSEYRFKVSSDIKSGFQELCHRLLESIRENVQSRQRESKGLVTEALGPFEKIFQTL